MVLVQGMLQLGQITHVRRCPTAHREGLHRWDQSSELTIKLSSLQTDGCCFWLDLADSPSVAIHPCHWVCSLPCKEGSKTLEPGDGLARFAEIWQVHADSNPFGTE